MKYFNRDMVALAASGTVSVFDAYCEHLGAHLGHGGRVDGENIVCPFHGWEWNSRAATCAFPTKSTRIPGRLSDGRAQ